MMSLSESQYNRILAQNKQLYQELCARRKILERIKNIIISFCCKDYTEEEFLKNNELDNMQYLGQKILKVLNELEE